MSALTGLASAIIVVRNGERYIAQAIQSVLAQSCPVGELIIVDGESTDRTAEIVRGFDGLRMIQQPGSGLADARNAGILAANSNWIAFLDHDDEWLPDKLQRQFDALRARPGALYSLGWLEFFTDSDGPLPPGYTEKMLNQPRPGPTPGTLLARREVFDLAGLFEGRYSIGCDLAWIKRLRELGIQGMECSDVLLRKRLHAGNLSRQARINRGEIFDILRASLRPRHG